MHVNRQLCLALSSSLVAMLAACGGGQGDSTIKTESLDRPTVRALAATAESSLPIPNVAVIGLTKIRETRITRTEFEYVYSVTVSNSGTPAADVTATLDQVPAGTKIVDGKAVFGAVPKTQSQTSQDTITIRHDRTVAFIPTSLKWAITLAPSADAVGQDIDRNGIRDDIDYLVKNIAGSDSVRAVVLNNVAKSMQSVLAASPSITEGDARALLLSELWAGLCLSSAMSTAEARAARDSLFWGTFDTKARRQTRQLVLMAAGAYALPEELPTCN